MHTPLSFSHSEQSEESLIIFASACNQKPEMLASLNMIERNFERSSVQIGLGEWKSVFDQFDPRFDAISDNHLHYVESEKYIRVLQHPEPRQRATGDSFPFVAIHCSQWPAEIFPRPRFYFDKHKRVVVATYDVDFAAGAAPEIAEQNFVTATLEESAR